MTNYETLLQVRVSFLFVPLTSNRSELWQFVLENAPSTTEVEVDRSHCCRPNYRA